jgi:hypothetical protein
MYRTVCPSVGLTVLYMVLYSGGLLVISVVGLLWLRRLWLSGSPAPAAPAAPADVPPAPDVPAA